MSERQARNEAIQSFILHNLRKHPGDIARLTAEKFDVSRQTAWKHVSILVQAGKIKAEGEKNKREYSLVPLASLRKSYAITPDIAEDKIWRLDVAPMLRDFPENVRRICEYGFSEMVNNAIEHSEGLEIVVDVSVYFDVISFSIYDNGMGIFNKIQRVYRLDDPIHAILELSKGKLSTDPEHHTGEGIFFTSRMFDKFNILSHNLCFTHDAKGFDYLLEGEEKAPRGTLILMEIATDSPCTTMQIFREFTTPESNAFERTIVPVFLARYGEENLVSRSQARRLLARFEKFREVVLDFARVDSIGQAFADEVFRVFQNEHPSVHLLTINENEQVRFMINRAKLANV